MIHPPHTRDPVETSSDDDSRGHQCANPSCARTIAPERRPATLYCTPACSARARAARYRATSAGRARAQEYRRSRAEAERARARRRRVAARLQEQSERLERVRASVDAALPRTSEQIEAVRRHVTALAEQVEELTAQRDAALADARQLARLARHLFLTTGTPGFARPGVQDLLGAHLTAADRRHIPPAFAGADLPGLGIAAGARDDRG